MYIKSKNVLLKINYNTKSEKEKNKKVLTFIFYNFVYTFQFHKNMYETISHKVAVSSSSKLATPRAWYTWYIFIATQIWMLLIYECLTKIQHDFRQKCSIDDGYSKEHLETVYECVSARPVPLVVVHSQVLTRAARLCSVAFQLEGHKQRKLTTPTVREKTIPCFMSSSTHLVNWIQNKHKKLILFNSILFSGEIAGNFLSFGVWNAPLPWWKHGRFWWSTGEALGWMPFLTSPMIWTQNLLIQNN